MKKIKSFLSLIFAKRVLKKNQAWKKNPVAFQKKTMLQLIERAKKTKFGEDFDEDEYDFLGTVSNWAECEQEISNETESAVLANQYDSLLTIFEEQFECQGICSSGKFKNSQSESASNKSNPLREDIHSCKILMTFG